MATSQHFKDDELACHCGCGLNVIDDHVLFMLEEARHSKQLYMPEKPSIRLNCACRCQKHNDSLPDSVKNSSHVPKRTGTPPPGTNGRDYKTYALDIDFDDDVEMVVLIIVLSGIGFNRFGICHRKKYIHTDYDPTKKSNTVWTY